jgi:porin
MFEDYSAVGAGIVFLKDKAPLFTYTAISPNNAPTTGGFDTAFENGVAIAAELCIPTNFFDKPGHQLIAATWSNRGYTSFDQDPRLLLGAIITQNPALLQRKSDSWTMYYNFDQHQVVDPCNPAQG